MSKYVLIVDHDPAIRNMLEVLFTSQVSKKVSMASLIPGVTPLLAKDVKEAILKLQDIASEDLLVVITNYGAPVEKQGDLGTNGPALVKFIKEEMGFNPLCILNTGANISRLLASEKLLYHRIFDKGRGILPKLKEAIKEYWELGDSQYSLNY